MGSSLRAILYSDKLPAVFDYIKLVFKKSFGSDTRGTFLSDMLSAEERGPLIPAAQGRRKDAEIDAETKALLPP